MSIDRCFTCGVLIDTDERPESYREEVDDLCLCDRCYQVFEVFHADSLKERGDYGISG